MAVDSPEQPALFGKAILAAARTVGGAAKERAYKSSFFKYAYQLRNGSVLTQQVIELSGPNSRSVFFVTGPVRADQVDYLIYD